MIKRIFFLSCLCSLALIASAKADTIGPTDCGSCLGSSYTLTYTKTSNPNIFDIFLTVNTTASTLPGDFLNAVAFKIAPNSSDITAASLLSFPSTFGSTLVGGLSAGGCAMGSDGFVCSQSSSATGVPVGSTYNYEWSVTLTSGGLLFTGAGAASIKALYVDSTGKQAGLTSEDITLQPGAAVPEPSTLILLGTGAFGIAGVLRRKFLG